MRTWRASLQTLATTVSPMALAVRQAAAAEAAELHHILRECGLDMQTRLGLSHWVPPYPFALFEEQTASGNVYAVRDESGTLLATFTASSESPAYYHLSLWDPEGQPALYATRLAVLPAFQGRGIGTECMAFFERLAIESGCRSVRLDALSAHAELLTFYDRLGYRRIGSFEAHGSELVGFEKLLV
jgi:ribosomal protein S18 acetylase RimI-like enzyme